MLLFVVIPARARPAERRRPRARRAVRLGGRPAARARHWPRDARASAPAPRRGHAVSRLAMPLAPLAVAFAAGIALSPWLAPRAAWALLAAALAATVLVLGL